MNNLYRDLAPVPAAAWEEIEEEARNALNTRLAARRLVDVEGPLGLEAAAVNAGRTQVHQGGEKGVDYTLRTTQPLVEMRVPFTLSRAELETISRGGEDADLDPVVDAARKIAAAEDGAVFYGDKKAGIEPLVTGDAGLKLDPEGDVAEYPRTVAEAVHRLREAGVGGPYALALGPDVFKKASGTPSRGAMTVLDHMGKVTGGNVIWAPTLSGGLVVSRRGGDFELTLGRDIALGYLSHDAESVTLFMEESFTARVLAPEAAVSLSA